MDFLSTHCLVYAYIDMETYAHQEKQIRELCYDWINELYKMNAYAENEVIEHNLLKINTMYGMGVIKKIQDKSYFPPAQASMNILVDLTEFAKVSEEAKPLLISIINAYFRNSGRSLFAIALNTLIKCNMINNIDTIKRKAAIDTFMGLLQNSPDLQIK